MAYTGMFRTKKLPTSATKALDEIERQTKKHSNDFQIEASKARRARLDQDMMSLHVTPSVRPSSVGRTSFDAGRRTKNKTISVNLPRKVKGELGEFFGRVESLNEVHAFLKVLPSPSNASTASSASSVVSDVEPVICVVHGMGAVGKTRLAQEYAQQHVVDYDWIFWARAESDIELMASYNAFAKKLKINAVGENRLEQTREWFSTTGRSQLPVL